MAVLTTRLLEVLQMGETIGGILDLPEKSLPHPGQYLPAQSLESGVEIVTQHLFRVIAPGEQPVLGPIPTIWAPGDQVAYIPVQGKGFQLPSGARRVGLLSLKGQPMRILPLVEPALAQNASVALFFDAALRPNLLDIIPSSVEISPLSALVDNLDWPDFLALEVDRENLADLTDLLGDSSLNFLGQVLVRTDMPCRGIGECGVCAVKTRKGWRQACIDGPVFPLKELLHVAG